MEITANNIVFALLAMVIIVFSVLTVTSRKILRAATYLLFVLFATAALYLQLNYEFLAAVQLTIYAGGILVLYIFSILLTSHIGEKTEPVRKTKWIPAMIVALSGFGVMAWLVVTTIFAPSKYSTYSPDMKEIGTALMGADRGGYILPFEVISVFLLACIIGAILIARKR